MLQIQGVAVEMIRHLRKPLGQIEKADRDLGRQLRRAAASVVLNMGEASGSAGGTRRERYRTALGSLWEVHACLQVAEAFGYTREVPAEAWSCARRVAAGLRKLA
jgi:four helix bundle protein